MADIKLNTRISLKYDLYTNWETNNPVLNKGEVALAYIPTDGSATFGNATILGTTPPNVVAKIGDGTSHYNDLKYLSALAADVPAWAKAVSKPEYTASEIKDLETFIAGEIQDTDTQYTLVKVNAHQYKLMSKGISDESFTTEVGVIDIPQYDDTKVKQDISANATAIATLNGDATTAGSVAKTVADAITALNLANTYAAKVHTHTKAEITDFAHEHAVSEVTGLQDTLNTFETKTDAANKLTEAKNYADGKDEAIAAAKKAGDDAQDAVDALDERVGALPEGATATTVVGYVDEKAAAAQKAGDDAQDAVEALDERVGALPEGATSTTVVGYVDEKAAEAKKAGDDAQDAVDALDERVGALPEGATATTVVGYVDEKVGAANAELAEDIAANTKAIEDEAARAAAKEAEFEGVLNTYKTTNDERVAAAEGEIDELQIQIAGLTGAMHFKGTVDAVPEAGAEGYVSGDVVVVTSTHKEWVYDGTTWHELGDEGSHITKTEVANTYETKADATTKNNALTQAIADEEARAKAAEEANAKAVSDLETEVGNTYETKNDAAAKLTEAKGYADTKDGETLAAAKTYAEEQAAAAKSGAEATAAADATTKADAARDAAKAYADELNTAMDTRVKAVEEKPAMGLTAEQIAGYDGAVTTAASAVQTVTTGTGLKAERTGNDVVLNFDQNVTFVFDCGTSAI